jgi:ribosomal protein S18 acetylase RimI-like enzyme
MNIGTPSTYKQSKLIGTNSPTELKEGSYWMNIKENNEIVASLYVKPYNNTAYIIRDVFVSEKYRNKGYGSQLISGILEHLKPKNRSIYLYVDPKNIGAMNLYKKFNFKLIKSDGVWGDKYKFIP